MEGERFDGGINPELLARAIADVMPLFNVDVYQRDSTIAAAIARDYYRFLSPEYQLRVRRCYAELVRELPHERNV